MNNDTDDFDWWIDTDSESDLDVLASEYDGDEIDNEEECLGFLAGDYASDAELLGFLGF